MLGRSSQLPNLRPMPTTYEVTAAFTNELAAHGLREVCLSPGGRSTPLALTFARHPGIRHWTHHDERSAAFFALGIAKETGRPVAVVTTSGTAAAELYPAVIEANYGQTGLLLLTADRPPDLRGTGANQTIDQVQLYGSSVKWFHDAPLPDATTLARTQAMAARAWTSAVTPPPGPVHINLPFAEPLTPTGDLPGLRLTDAAASWTTTASNPDEESLRGLAAAFEDKRGVILAGPSNDRALAPAVTDLARALGWPVLADPLSGLRTRGHDLSQVLATGDAMARAGFLERAAPEAVLRFGSVPTSKAINSWLGSNPQMTHAVINLLGAPDPSGTAGIVMAADPGRTATGLAKLVTRGAPEGWLTRWVKAEATARRVLDEATADGFSELAIVAAVLGSLPRPARLWVAASMPIRYLDLLLPTTPTSLDLYSNRGASGIDGFISSGLGTAAVAANPVYLLAGDLSLLYDLTALATAGRYKLDATIVVINNDGGAIFHMLPQAALPEVEEIFAAPHGLEFEKAASLFDIRYHRLESTTELADLVSQTPDGPRLIEVRTRRDAAPQAIEEVVGRLKAALAG